VNLSSPVTSIIPSLDGAIVVALCGVDLPQSLTEIHRLLDRGSLSGVRLVLQRLVSVGVVLDVPGGYVLNREHLTAPAISLLAALHGELLKRIRTVVDRWDGVELVGLFGSAARRDGDEGSDIDIVIVSKTRQPPELVDELARQVECWTGNRADVFALNLDELHELELADEPLLRSWRNELVTVVGDSRVLGH